jgi:uncharacterized protein YjbI with pentapeptide repeats
VQFKSRLAFTYTWFYSGASFASSKLNDPYFWETSFINGITIDNCFISGFPVFKIRVYGETDILSTVICPSPRSHATFGIALFRGRTRFQIVEFHSVCLLNDIEFSKYVLFDECQFDIVNFDNSKFRTSADFIKCRFNDRTYFRRTRFLGETKLRGIIFDSLVDFSETEFASSADFSEAKLKRSNFTDTTFNKAFFTRTEFVEAYFKLTKFKDEAKFNFSSFIEPEKIIFTSLNLSNVSFMFSDITRIKFDNVKWGKERNEFKIYDERLLEQELEGTNEHDFEFSLDDILAVYRNLRENYEFRMKYDEAGSFFIREMELRRNYEEA